MSTALQKVDLRNQRAELQTSGHIENWFTKQHKAAIVLASLSAETAASIVAEIPDTELRAFAKAFSELKTVSPQLLHTVAEEFLSEVNQTSNDLSGGADEARRVLGMMVDEDRAGRVFGEFNETGDDGAVWTRLEKVENETLAEYVQAQRMPVAAVILSKLGYEKTAQVLDLTEGDYAKRILLEIARKQPPSAEAIEAIANVIEEDLLKPAPGASEGDEDGEEGEGSGPKNNAGAAVGEIINFLPGTKRDAFLQHLQEADPEVGAEVRKAVLTFEELYNRMPASGATALLRDLERDVLLCAIKHGEKNAAETVEFLFGNISKRMVEQYKEELAELEEPSEAAGEAAQREVTAAVRALVKQGEFKLIAIKTEE